jgi:tetratricopeptide (TPR) repeat protein
MEIDNYQGENESLTLNLPTYPAKNVVQGVSPYAQSRVAALDKDVDDAKRIYNYDLILKDYEMVIKLNPDFVYAYFNRGNLLFSSKDYRSAIADYDQATGRNPDFAEAYFNRGLARLLLGDTERGISDLSKAGELGTVDAYSIIKKMTAD